MAQSKVETKAKGKAKDKPEPKTPEKPAAKIQPEQMTLVAEAPVMEAAPPAAAAQGDDAVVELLRNRKGCWKKLANGEGVAISEKEWQQELSRLLSRRAAPANDSGERASS